MAIHKWANLVSGQLYESYVCHLFMQLQEITLQRSISNYDCNLIQTNHSEENCRAALFHFLNFIRWIYENKYELNLKFKNVCRKLLFLCQALFFTHSRLNITNKFRTFDILKIEWRIYGFPGYNSGIFPNNNEYWVIVQIPLKIFHSPGFVDKK